MDRKSAKVFERMEEEIEGDGLGGISFRPETTARLLIRCSSRSTVRGGLALELLPVDTPILCGRARHDVVFWESTAGGGSASSVDALIS